MSKTTVGAERESARANISSVVRSTRAALLFLIFRKSNKYEPMLTSERVLHTKTMVGARSTRAPLLISRDAITSTRTTLRLITHLTPPFPSPPSPSPPSIPLRHTHLAHIKTHLRIPQNLLTLTPRIHRQRRAIRIQLGPFHIPIAKPAFIRKSKPIIK
jgi:hypothetical protein